VRRRERFVRGVCGLVLVFLAAAALAQGPAGDWRTIESRHYRVHYPEPLEAWAKRAAERLEGIHEAVSALVGYAPKRKTDVLVRDPTASPNGMAFPFLDRPYIVLWATPPASDSGIGFYGDWVDLLVTHEVAHVVHLARPRNRSPEIFSRLLPLGPVTLSAPRWIIEGYATLVEGELTGSGRPHSSWRALVLRRLAIEGKLPEYAELSSTEGWLGGSMAYLTGSAYLEWLQRRAGREALPKLWRRMASSRGGGFGVAFRAVFEQSPEDLYDRFRAELTAAALAQQERLKQAGLAAGEPWQRLKGGTWSPQVSPDGKWILARRDPEPRKGYLAVWSIAPSAEELAREKTRLEKEEEWKDDPEEVVDYRDPARARTPVHRLRRENGYTPYAPRWMPGSDRILFARNAPDSDGVLRRDLHLWTPSNGDIARVTKCADVGDADPAPDGTWAAGVQARFGKTDLVRVDLRSGSVAPISTDVTDPWAVWTDPRVSPDGSTIAALLHRRGGWRLVTLPAEGGPAAAVELPGSPISPPAWSADGATLYVSADVEGIPEAVAVPRTGGSVRVLTRSESGALAPAPMPDGSALFFLELTAKGMNLARLDLPAPAPAPLSGRSADWPLLPPAEAGVSRLPAQAGQIDPPEPYSVSSSHLVRPVSAFSIGPDGNAFQVGVEGNDILDRFDWAAMGSLGDAAGPRGASVAAAWRGLPVRLSMQLFTALEQPGAQELVPRQELDSERWGGFLDASWGRPWSWGSVSARAGAGATQVEARPSGDTFDRYVFSGEGRAAWRRIVGESGWRAAGQVEAAGGATDGDSWSLFSGGLSLSGVLPFATFTLAGAAGTLGGDPTVYDLFAIGGAASAILPPGLDPARIEAPAMPAAVQLGDRFERLRAEIDIAGLPVLLYGERLRAWTDGFEKPESVRLLGAELRLSAASFDLATPGTLEIYLGVARVQSDEPLLDSTRGYAGLMYRP
jgi:Tol biopolymer transport system component